MITEDTIKKTKFYIGEDEQIYLVTDVRSVKQFKLINCIDGTESTPLLFGDDLCRTFIPVVPAFKPFIENQVVAQLPVKSKSEQPVNKHKSTSKKKNSNRNTSEHKGVERLKPNKSGQVKFKTSWWNGKTKKNIYLGTYDSELIAAAAYQDRLGNKAEAAKLRAQAKQQTTDIAEQQTADLAEQKENNPNRPSPGGRKKKIWTCKRDGLEYRTDPTKSGCPHCGGFDFRVTEG